MKNTYKKPVKTNNVPTKQDKIKGFQVWTFILIILAGFAHSQYQMVFMLPAEAHDAPVTLDDRLGEVLDPKGTIVIKEGKDPAWGTIKEPKMAEVSAYTSRVAETDDTPCIAANGKDICKLHAKGIQTCASNDYRLGVTLEIEGLGRCIVSDRMNRRYTGTGRVDWYMGMDLKGALNHGVKKLTVKEL